MTTTIEYVLIVVLIINTIAIIADLLRSHRKGHWVQLDDDAREDWFRRNEDIRVMVKVIESLKAENKQLKEELEERNDQR